MFIYMYYNCVLNPCTSAHRMGEVAVFVYSYSVKGAVCSTS